MIALVQCADATETNLTPHRLLMTAPPAGGKPQFHTDFASAASGTAPVSITIDYSNDQQYFSDEGLGIPTNSTAALRKRGLLTDFATWVASLKNVNADKSIALATSFSETKRVLDQALTGVQCTGAGALEGAASITADVSFSADIHGVFGVRVQGTLVPLDLTGRL